MWILKKRIKARQIYIKIYLFKIMQENGTKIAYCENTKRLCVAKTREEKPINDLCIHEFCIVL